MNEKQSRRKWYVHVELLVVQANVAPRALDSWFCQDAFAVIIHSALSAFKPLVVFVAIRAAHEAHRPFLHSSRTSHGRMLVSCFGCTCRLTTFPLAVRFLCSWKYKEINLELCIFLCRYFREHDTLLTMYCVLVKRNKFTFALSLSCFALDCSDFSCKRKEE